MLLMMETPLQELTCSSGNVFTWVCTASAQHILQLCGKFVKLFNKTVECKEACTLCSLFFSE